MYVSLSLPSQLSEEALAAIDNMASQKRLDYILVKVNDRHVLLMKSNIPHKNIIFNSGMATIQCLLGGLDVRRLPLSRPVPAKAINEMFMNGYQSKAVLARKGDTFKEENIFEILSTMSDRRKMLINQDVPLRQLVEGGTIEAMEVQWVAAAINHLSVEDTLNTFDQKEDLDGELELAFRPYDEDGVPLPDGRETKVKIIGLPGDRTKKKNTIGCTQKKLTTERHQPSLGSL